MYYVKLSESTAARKRVPIYLVDATDGFTPETGVATPTIEVSKNGGAQAAGSGTFTEIGDGVYYYEFAAGEIDTLGWVNLRCVKSGTSREYQAIVHITAHDVYDSVRLGMTSLPNAAAEAAGGLYTRGSGAGQINQPTNGRIDSRTMAMDADVLTAAALGADAVTEIQTGLATSANQTTILNRLGAFAGSGTNTILGFFRALLRKDAALTPSDVGGTFDNTSDSLESAQERQAVLSTQASVDVINGLLDNEIALIKAKTDLIPASPAAVGSAMTLTSGERDAIAAALFDLANAIEAGVTLRMAQRAQLTAAAGKSSGAGGPAFTLRNVGDTKDRIVASTDGAGNRTAVALDLT